MVADKKYCAFVFPILLSHNALPMHFDAQQNARLYVYDVGIAHVPLLNEI